ncbi:aspartate carbamoyltransferase [Bacillus cereus group sp. MYBK12-2]|jgi:aspartate carbamoyltransferase catalytic subunit|uniref:Aspartate carbamoyltransferase n=2 Tax=Bacillus cereus group TaxID=86661 RepID=A0A151V2V9_BACCE|nr:MULTISPECIES: aspartate carbamoyltransferase [Bacillus cereus group]EJR42876.1 aspartate carbamoyltransferase [Bacillus cereus VD102]KLA01263.1 Aspartate carbamoyltransferase [Bacillus cereus]KMP90306.1 hypothetical protein TU63_04745 [Bacillus cereus]KXY22473.1 hypothetical protein AT273_08165 [Bacillus cereus]KYQ04315.1 Aspartate carbamoyltransferase [Bacillus cereus]
MSQSIRHLLSMDDLSESDIQWIFEKAEHYKKNNRSNLSLKGQIVGLLFYEPSTRTYQSFSSAAQRLGGGVIGFGDPTSSSAAKGETLSDTIQVMQTFADLLVVRHPTNGALKPLREIAQVPIINGGDGSNEHPTQTLYDLFTINEIFGKIDNLTIGFVGDLKYGRTVHSLTRALLRYNCKLYWIAPDRFQPDVLDSHLSGHVEKVSEIDEVISELDVLYVSRPQRERWSSDEQGSDLPIIDNEVLRQAKSSLAVMHALPRVNEIALEVDSNPRAKYFQQVSNAVPVRMAILDLIGGNK